MDSILARLALPDTDNRLHALDDLAQLLREQPHLLQDRDRDRALVAALKPCVKSSNSLIANHALAALEPFFLALQGQGQVTAARKHALTHLLPWERLADAKPNTRKLATRAVVAAARAALASSSNPHSDPHPDSDSDSFTPWTLIEAGLKEHGLASKNARAREQAVHILATLRTTAPAAAASASASSSTTAAAPSRSLPPLRPFTPLLLPLLADADPHVRSAALDATVRIFADPAASDRARADLKSEMQRIGVAQKTQDQILAQVLGGDGGSEQTLPQRRTRSTSPASWSGPSGSGVPATVPPSPPVASTSAGATAAPSSHGPPPSGSAADVGPVYLASERDLDAEFAAMRAGFEGRESEHNWTARDRSVARIRGMLVARVADRDGGRLCEPFVRNVRDVQDGIIKTASSLRTTVALSALALIAELAVALPPSPASEHLLDTFLAHCLSVAGQTKKIVAAASQATVTTLLEHQHYHPHHHHSYSSSSSSTSTPPLRTVQLVVALLNEKTPSARQFGAQHVLTLLRRLARESSSFTSPGSSKKAATLDSGGGGGNAVVIAAELEAAVGKGLQDANPQVRETSRVAFWEFDKLWLDKALAIAAGLDPSGRRLLDKARPALAHPAAETDVAPPAPLPARVAVGPPILETEPDSPTSSPLRARVGPTAATVASGGKKPSVREAMMAARKRMLAEKDELRQSPSTATAGDPGLLNNDHEGPCPLAPSLPPPVPIVSASPALGEEDAPPATEGGTPTRSRPTWSSPTSTESAQRDEVILAVSAAPPPPPLHAVESIVDDALRDQARQAELAAERLLELSIDETDDQHGIPPPPPPSSTAVATAASVTPRSERRSARTPRTTTTLGGPFSTPVPNPALKRFALAGHNAAVFEDSPDPRDATGAAAGRGGWWARRPQSASVAATSAPTDDAEEPTVIVTDLQRAELAKLVAQLCRGDDLVDGSGVLRKLSELSRQVPIRASAADSDADPFAQVEDGDSRGGPEQQRTSASFWREDRAFDKTYDRLRSLLLSPEANLTEPARDAALRLLRDLVENQSPCFVGAEVDLFELVLKLRENPSRSSIAATEVISTSFATRLEPVYGLGVLKPALSSYLTTAEVPSPGSYTLALRLLGGFLERLPGEVVEDVLPQWADLLRTALEDTDSGDLRRAAIMALVSAQSALASSAVAADDEVDGLSAQRLDELLSGLRPDQLNLVAYYRARQR
ncbi:hypothetical protein JCM3774_002298 [Rhodotorula dairenensis]